MGQLTAQAWAGAAPQVVISELEEFLTPFLLLQVVASGN